MNDGDHKIDADGDPDLSLHRVGTRPVVMFDAQVPLMHVAIRQLAINRTPMIGNIKK